LGATNRPDIIDPALMRPGRLDSLIYIGLPDFEARISIFKACLRKSPVDPEVDYEYLADRTEGFSGADIAGVCKSAAKSAIRDSIATERRKFELREAKKKEAEAKGETFEEDEKDEEDPVPYLTKKMLVSALSFARRSVSKADLEKHMKYKRDMERKLGMDEGNATMIDSGAGHAGVIGLDPERRPGRAPVGATNPTPTPAVGSGSGATPAAAPAPAPAVRTFADDGADDDIYDS